MDLEQLAEALNCRWNRARRRIDGASGMIYPYGQGFAVSITQSKPQALQAALARLRWFRIIERKVIKATLYLPGLPTPAQAQVLRQVLGIP